MDAIELVLNKENSELYHKDVGIENCITGDNDYLIDKLLIALKKAKRIDIIVAFLMETGIRLLAESLKEAVERGVSIRILTGNYLNITQPQALYLLKDVLGDKVDLRFYNVKNRSFHPKAYIFDYDNDEGEIFIGSSNISWSALTYGIEWNYRIKKEVHEKDFKHYKEIFEDLFFNKSIIVDDAELKRYSLNWRKPKVFSTIDEIDEENKLIQFIQPRGAQIEALYELKKARENDLDKALVVAATGIGKTYLAAFDSKLFSRVLFVAHREEILTQAEKSFKKVRGNINTGFFGNGRHDKGCEVLFATVQSLGKEEYLNNEYFEKDYFEYIIIDEFHHATANNYQKIINYFMPKFLLGITATPERMDNKDVFALCDYNVVYEVGLKSAINKGWLVPFRYYGIYDNTNYENIQYKNGKYDDEQLEETLMISRRADLILNNYKKYNSQRALGFCSSKRHAEYMAKYFVNNGVEACAVYSGTLGEYSAQRKEAISKLIKGKLKVIFSVDMFNEGLDVQAIDLVMFLRPTQSSTIFLQQLGRGLRKSTDKKYLNVLDFIGNYKKANLVPFFLTGNTKQTQNNNKSGELPKEEEYPEDCIVDFEWQIIDIFERERQSKLKIKQIILEEYNKVKSKLGHRPTRLEMLTYMDNNIYYSIKKKSKENIFKNYINFLNENNQLLEEEKQLIKTKAQAFINMVETTSMSKTYKMPILLAFYNNGNFKLKINEDEIYISFKEFYNKGSNGIDMLKHKSTADYKNWDKKQYVKHAKDNPINFLAKSHSEFFYKEDNYFCINDELEEFKNNNIFIEQVKDAIEFRVREYYKTRMEINIEQ